MKFIAGTSVALILVASFANAAENDQLDRAMKIFHQATNKVDAVLFVQKSKHPTKDLDIHNKDNIGIDAQLYNNSRTHSKIIDAIYNQYLLSEDDSDRLHWFMLFTTITHREAELVDIITSGKQKRLTKNIINLYCKTDIDPVYYIEDWELKAKMYKVITDAR